MPLARVGRCVPGHTDGDPCMPGHTDGNPCMSGHIDGDPCMPGHTDDALTWGLRVCGDSRHPLQASTLGLQSTQVARQKESFTPCAGQAALAGGHGSAAACVFCSF
eukprot:353783-Chlamydomonas_euryale.AAC.7